MSEKIVFLTDPLGNNNPFGNPDVQQFCFNVSEWMAQHREFETVAYQLGCICLCIGFLIGLIAGYYFAKGKFDDGSC